MIVARKKASKISMALGKLGKLCRMIAGPWRPWALTILLLGLFAGGWYSVWKTAGPDVLASPEYWVTPDTISVTEPPIWIRTDIRTEVVRNASLDRPLSIMDDNLTERAARAFAMHPWVAKVHRVVKFHPSGLRVELEYRRPVCMVETESRTELLPVDIQGIVLPGGDFSPVESSRYPRLAKIDSIPVGVVGESWGDGRVVGGAEIAGAFGSAWQELKLDRIVPSMNRNQGYTEACTYELFTRGGTRILWGHDPSTELPGEAPAVDKIARLKKYAAEHGTLEGHNGPQTIDARSAQTLQTWPLATREVISSPR